MKPSALYVIPNNSTFTRVDERILSAVFDLKQTDLCQGKSKAKYLLRMMGMALRIFKEKPDVVIVWFADYHAAIAVLAARGLKKKSVIFVGGYDAVSYPLLKMGVYQSFLRGLCARFALRHAGLIIANHEALLESSNTYYRPEGHPEGIFRLVPRLKTKAVVVHNAITIPAPFAQGLGEGKEELFLCVGTTPRFDDIINKGFDLVARVAKLHPQWRFEIIGIDPKWQAKFIHQYGLNEVPNLKIDGYLPHQTVLARMKSSRYYIQASISEGMPNALMEAMLMGCIPIGSNVAGIPTIIADQGLIFTKRHPLALEQAIIQAMTLDISSADISKRISQQFSLANRQAGIVKAMGGIFALGDEGSIETQF